MSVELNPLINDISRVVVLKTAILPGDDKETLFVATIDGKIYVLREGEKKLFLDLGKYIVKDGFKGLEFHPNFEDNGKFYLNYNQVIKAVTLNTVDTNVNGNNRNNNVTNNTNVNVTNNTNVNVVNNRNNNVVNNRNNNVVNNRNNNVVNNTNGNIVNNTNGNVVNNTNNNVVNNTNGNVTTNVTTTTNTSTINVTEEWVYNRREKYSKKVANILNITQRFNNTNYNTLSWSYSNDRLILLLSDDPSGRDNNAQLNNKLYGKLLAIDVDQDLCECNIDQGPITSFCDIPKCRQSNFIIVAKGLCNPKSYSELNRLSYLIDNNPSLSEVNTFTDSKVNFGWRTFTGRLPTMNGNIVRYPKEAKEIINKEPLYISSDDKIVGGQVYNDEYYILKERQGLFVLNDNKATKVTLKRIPMEMKSFSTLGVSLDKDVLFVGTDSGVYELV